MDYNHGDRIYVEEKELEEKCDSIYDSLVNFLISDVLRVLSRPSKAYELGVWVEDTAEPGYTKNFIAEVPENGDVNHYVDQSGCVTKGYTARAEEAGSLEEAVEIALENTRAEEKVGEELDPEEIVESLED